MKRIALLCAIMFVLSAAVHAQTITITLSGNETGWLNCPEANVSAKCWFRSTATTTGLSGLPWLVNGVYTGQVSMKKNGDDGIIIFGGPNDIKPGRGIFIHIGNSPNDSNGCVVIGGAQRGGDFYTLYSELKNTYGLNGRHFTIYVTK